MLRAIGFGVVVLLAWSLAGRLFAVVLTAALLLWWLLRPRRRGRRADRDAASPEPTYKAVKTFRTPGGFDTTVWEAEYRNGGLVQRWHAWTCDCGGGEEGGTLREAAADAVAHIERRHVR